MMSLSPWFPYYSVESKAKTLLFCLSHSGGVASNFRNWQAYFPSEIEVVPIQLPGRENRFKESFLTSMKTLVDRLLPEIIPFLNRKIVFFGHSLGGLIAYELANNIRNKEITLVISSCSPPHLLSSRIQLHQLPEDEFIKHVTSYGGLPQAILESPEALQILTQRLKADFEIFETYQFSLKPPLNVPLFVCGGTSDEVVPEKNLLEWEKYTTGPFQPHLFEGGHFYLQLNQKKLCSFILGTQKE